MNRRSFLRNLAVAAAGFTILPAATTYARKWVPTPAGVLARKPILNPEWVTAQYQITWLRAARFKSVGGKVIHLNDDNLVTPYQEYIDSFYPRYVLLPNGNLKAVYKYTPQ